MLKIHTVSKTRFWKAKNSIQWFCHTVTQLYLAHNDDACYPWKWPIKSCTKRHTLLAILRYVSQVSKKTIEKKLLHCEIMKLKIHKSNCKHCTASTTISDPKLTMKA